MLLAGDHLMVREALATMLTAVDEIEVVCQEPIKGERLGSAVANYCPDILVLDFDVVLSEHVDVIKRAQRADPGVRIMILATHCPSDALLALLKIGVMGCVLKSEPVENLRQAVRTLARGDQWLSRPVTSVLINSFRQESTMRNGLLTGREVEVIQLVGYGLKNGAIASTLGTTEKTIRNHVHHILQKLQLDTRIEAALYAIAKDLVDITAVKERFEAHETEQGLAGVMLDHQMADDQEMPAA